MTKFILLFLPLFVFGRVNPFEPIVEPYNYQIFKPNYLKKERVYLPTDARILKEVIFVYKTLQGDIKEKKVVINKAIDFHKPIVLTHKVEKFPLIKLHFLDLLDVYIKNRTIFLSTKDRLVRHMFLVSPYRLVLDFERDADFLRLEKEIKKSVVKKIVVGNHNGYYRVVIYFDAKYFYKIERMSNGVKIELR